MKHFQEQHQEEDKLNSKVGKVFTYEQLLEWFSNRPNKIRALV